MHCQSKQWLPQVLQSLRSHPALPDCQRLAHRRTSRRKPRRAPHAFLRRRRRRVGSQSPRAAQHPGSAGRQRQAAPGRQRCARAGREGDQAGRAHGPCIAAAAAATGLRLCRAARRRRAARTSHPRWLPHLDGCTHEGPALVADVPLLAAGAHIIVIRQVDIKHKLTLHGREALACRRGQGGRQQQAKGLLCVHGGGGDGAAAAVCVLPREPFTLLLRSAHRLAQRAGGAANCPCSPPKLASMHASRRPAASHSRHLGRLPAAGGQHYRQGQYQSWRDSGLSALLPSPQRPAPPAQHKTALSQRPALGSWGSACRRCIIADSRLAAPVTAGCGALSQSLPLNQTCGSGHGGAWAHTAHSACTAHRP